MCIRDSPPSGPQARQGHRHPAQTCRCRAARGLLRRHHRAAAAGDGGLARPRPDRAAAPGRPLPGPA
eukprot:5738213-Prymnesium_polylepis.1